MEFLKDIAALANASGGEIIYGIEESNGAASAILPITDETFDEARRRLAQSALASVEPPLQGLHFTEIRVKGGWCLAIRVPASFASPHRYGAAGASRFVVRESGFVRDMSYTEVRDAFTRVGEARAQVAAFRQRRVEEILGGDTWRAMSDEPLCVVQVIPLSAFASLTGLDIHQTYETWDKFIQSDWAGGSRTFNLDGLVIYPGGNPPLHAYVQVYRNGVVEGLFTAGHWSHENTIPSLSVANCIRQTVLSAFGEYQRQARLGPAIVYVSLLKVKDYRLGIGNSFPSLRPLTSDRHNLLLPDVLVDASGDGDRTEAALRQILNVMWQCFGSASCNYYDQDGRWAPPR